MTRPTYLLDVNWKNAVEGSYAPTFARASTAYLPDGTAVGVDVPRFPTVGGVQGLMVEEAVANLLRRPGATGLSTATDLTGGATKTDLGGGKYRFANTGANPSIVRLYCALADLTDGATYTGSVWYENATSGITLDWCDAVTSAAFPAGSGRAIVTGSRADYTTIYRFLDVNFAAGSSVTLYSDQLQTGAYATTYADTTRAAESATIPTSGVLSAAEGTVEGWFRPKALYNYSYPIYMSAASPISDRFAIYYDSSGNIVYSLSGWAAGSTGYAYSGRGTTVNVWDYLAMSWTDNGNGTHTVRAYCNGVLVGSHTGTRGVTVGSVLYIGSGGSGGQINGTISQFRLSDIARPQSEITAAYAAGTLEYDEHTTYLLRLDGSLDYEGGEWRNVGPLVRVNPGVSASRGRDQIRQLAPPAAGALDAELDNQSRDYSTENASSPLAGYLYPGHAVRWRADHSGTTYNLWRGILDDLPQYPDRAKRSVGIPCLGTLSRLRPGGGDQTRISTPLYSNIRTDQALGYLFDAVGWPAADRVLDTGKTTLLWWWLQDADPFAAMVEILAAEGPGATIYEDGQGRLVFESRHYRLLTARCTTSQATIDDSTAPNMAAMTINPGLKDVVNSCTIEVKTRSAKALAVMWSLGSTLTLAAGETRKVIATNSDPFTAAVAPVNATDYTVAAGSLASVTLDRTSGASCTITLTAGASGATVTGLQLRAQLVTVDNTTQVANTVDASASIAKYGKRTYPLRSRPEIALLVAQDFANAVVGWYQEPRPSVELTIIGASDANLAQCLTREVSDRITVTESESGLDADVFIEQISQRVEDTVHATTLGCEKIGANAAYFVWGVSTWGGGDVWGY